MKYFKAYIVIAIIVVSSTTSFGQIFKRVLDRTVDKMERKVEDKIVEGISTKIANRAVRPLDNMFDEMFKAEYKEQYGKDWDETEYEDSEQRVNAMQAMLSSMYGNVDLPENYVFDIVMHIELNDFGEKKSHNMKLLISESSEIFGMEQIEDGTKIMVFDFEKDIMTVYDEEKKTAMAIPNVMKMATTFQPYLEKEMKNKVKEYEFKKTKTKKILNCNSQGYKMESDEETSEFYVCDDLGFTWKDNLGKMLEKSAPNFYKDHPAYEVKGMLMESKTKRKKDKKESKWKTIKIDKSQYIVDNSKYKLENTRFDSNK